MRSRLILLTVLCTIFLTTGCYLPMSGTVIDAETKQPIEGAVVLVEWTKTKGFGFTYTESYKVAETISDKDGKFDLPGCYSPFVNDPDVTVYKKGYVAWSSRNIFPGNEKRTDFKWGHYVFKLETFKETYSHTDHQMFTTLSINSTIGQESKQLFMKTYDDGERGKVILEQNKRDLERMRGPRPSL